MSYTFVNNVARTIYNGAPVWYSLLNTALAVGWTWVAGGDGLSLYSTSGNIFTTAAGGAGGMGNASAHFTIQQPAGGVSPYAGTRQICVQIGAGFGTDVTRFNARVVFSETGADLTNASPTRCPAFIENPIFGGGTDASPSYANIMAINNGTVNIKFGDVNENFSFSMELWINGGAIGSAFFLDGCDQIDPLETSPFVVHCDSSDLIAASVNTDITFSSFSGSAQLLPIYAFGLPTAALPIREHAASGKVTFPTFYWARPNTVAAPGGYKGVSHLFKATTANKVKRQLGTKTTTDDTVVLSVDFSSDWDGSVMA